MQDQELFTATAPVRSGTRSYTPGEKEIGKHIPTGNPELDRLLMSMASERIRERQAGTQKFTQYLKGPSDGKMIMLQSGDNYIASWYEQGKWVNMQHDWKNGLLEDVLFKNFGIFSSWRWGARFFNAAGVTAVNMTISGVEEEHGWYVNLAKTRNKATPAIHWNKVLVENIGSQVLQTVVRPHETTDWERDTDPDTGAIFIENSVFRNFHRAQKVSGGILGATRPAQTVQCKAAPNDVYIINTLWDNTAVALSYGCLTVLGKIGGYGMDASHRKVWLENCQMFTAPSEQKPIWIEDVAEFTMLDCHLEALPGGKENFIDLVNVGKINISNCTGNVQIRVNKQFVGDISQGYVS